MNTTFKHFKLFLFTGLISSSFMLFGMEPSITLKGFINLSNNDNATLYTGSITKLQALVNRTIELMPGANSAILTNHAITKHEKGEYSKLILTSGDTMVHIIPSGKYQNFMIVYFGANNERVPYLEIGVKG